MAAAVAPPVARPPAVTESICSVVNGCAPYATPDRTRIEAAPRVLTIRFMAYLLFKYTSDCLA
jgi:hypothetical protein